jgi:hypothetical protein
MYFFGMTEPSMKTAGRELRDDALREDADREVVDDLDVIDCATQRGGARRDRFGRHDPLETELHVVSGDRVAVVESLILAEIEGPALAVGRELPALGDTRADSAVLEVEADQRVPDGSLIVRVRRAGVHDRVHDLGAQSVQDDDERVLVGGLRRWKPAGNQKTTQRQDQQAPCAHLFLLYWRRASVGGAPAPQRPAARTAFVDELGECGISSRCRILHNVAPRCQAGGPPA